MELLYLWINQSENEIFKNQEVQLSDKYKINSSFDTDVCTITISKNESYYNIYDNGVISNVSALVGSNGSGKTTLLNYIYGNDVMPKHIEDRAEYQRAEEYQFLKGKTIQVFEDSNRLIIIHNLEHKVVAPHSVYVIKMNNETFREMYSENSNLSSITKIYLTNGNYTDNDGYGTESGKPNRIVLSLRSIRTFTYDFFNKNVNFPQGLIEDSLYNGLQNIIISIKNDMDFQAICDVVYFNKLFNREKKSHFAGKISTELYISSDLLPVILNKSKVKRPLSYTSQRDYPSIIEQKLQKWNIFIRNIQVNIYDLSECMKLNFILELDFIHDVLSMLDSEPISINDLYLELIKTLEVYCVKQELNYYKSAAMEINTLELIIFSCHQFDNLYPRNDGAYEKKIKISYKEDPASYLKFINFIDYTAKKTNSFIFKYLKIENLKMSSGERAYLNFFSWINLLSFFHQISNNVLTSTRKNILLLIDEIELYCHPEWQRKFLSFLHEELSEQFSENRIQIIFSTHSPIVLSDIPLSNTVYIKQEQDGSSHIESRTGHKETFAANIYKLFNDSFFLHQQGAVGEFARNTINSIYMTLVLKV